MKQYKTIDLFAGAGGLSYGFLMTGKYKIVAAAEINKDAQKTYLANIPRCKNFKMINNVIGYDFKELNDYFNGIDVVIGGPPCQGFSNANRNKNHLISMNNCLIKEYFRAIKEIKPKAFILENVNMLQSNKHRFYESKKDAVEINRLIKSGHNIPKRRDIVYVSSIVYEEIDVDDIPKSVDYLLPDALFQLLNVFLKNTSNAERLKNYIEKNSRKIIKQINTYINTHDLFSISYLKKLHNIMLSVENDNINNCIDDLRYIIGLQKAIRIICEIQTNQLIGEYDISEKEELLFLVNTYSVIDYVNAILGGMYKQVGSTLCSEYFGVPQERRRYIVMGIRKDQCKEQNISLPEINTDQLLVTVNDAISDLEKYPTTYTTENIEIPYKKNEKLSKFAIEMRKGSKSIKNHIITNTKEKALARYELIKQGNNFHSLPAEQKDTYEKPDRTQNTIYLRLDPNKPCGTVVNVRKSMWIHPNLNRAISVREAARLQSFPDVFEFIGTKDSQYQQVGNAVPPLLAEEIARNLLKYL